jgi:hypothetical protein
VETTRIEQAAATSPLTDATTQATATRKTSLRLENISKVFSQAESVTLRREPVPVRRRPQWERLTIAR